MTCMRMNKTRKTKPRRMPINVPSRQYQPKKAEKAQSFDMPGLPVEKVGQVFLTPVTIKTTKNGAPGQT